MHAPLKYGGIALGALFVSEHVARSRAGKPLAPIMPQRPNARDGVWTSLRYAIAERNGEHSESASARQTYSGHRIDPVTTFADCDDIEEALTSWYQTVLEDLPEQTLLGFLNYVGVDQVTDLPDTIRERFELKRTAYVNAMNALKVTLIRQAGHTIDVPDLQNFFADGRAGRYYSWKAIAAAFSLGDKLPLQENAEFWDHVDFMIRELDALAFDSDETYESFWGHARELWPQAPAQLLRWAKQAAELATKTTLSVAGEIVLTVLEETWPFIVGGLASYQLWEHYNGK